MGLREALYEHLETVAQATFSDAHAYPLRDMPLLELRAVASKDILVAAMK